MASSQDDAGLVRRPRRTLRSILPVLDWLGGYDWGRNLGPDAIAGVAVAALLIPESMGFAGVAGVPPQFGLYAALGAVVVYALAGGVSILVVGPASAVAALSASLVAEFDGDPIVLTAALAIASGILLVASGGLRLGWVVNFISRPVLDGFVAGLSLSIIIGQLDGLLGIEVEGESAVARLLDTITQVGGWQVLTAIVGVGAVGLLLGMERVAARIPAAVVVVGVGILLAELLGLGDRGVALVGEIPQGLPTLSVPDLSGTRWVELLGAGTALLLVGFSEGYAAAAAIADETGEEIDADQELVGSGAANLAAGVLGGFAVSGSLSKSAAAQHAGAHTQMANLVAGLVVLGTLLVLAPLFEVLPEPILAAVVIVAVLPSADPRKVVRLVDVNRMDFAAAALTFTLVLVWETLPAMVVGVVLSLAVLVHRASFPDIVELRPDTSGAYRRADQLPDATAGPVPVLRFEGPLVYASSNRLAPAVRLLLDARGPTTRVVIDSEMMSDLDSTGAEVLEALDAELAARDITLHLARVHHRARRQLVRSGLDERFAGRMHATVQDAAGG